MKQIIYSCLFLLLGIGVCARATGPTNGKVFGDKSDVYDIDVTELDVWDNVSVELWLTMDRDCPVGAVILDKLGPGTKQGIRLETGANGMLRLFSSAPSVIETTTQLVPNTPTHVVATFDPRNNVAAIYINGKEAAALSVDPKTRITIIGSQTPVRIGSDQFGGHRFVGSISHVGLFNRAVSADEVAQLFAGPVKVAGEVVAGEVGAWVLKPDAGRRIDPVEGRGEMVAALDVQPAAAGPGGDLTLWYQRPAREWLESLPFGNGRLGGTVFGGINHERIQLNEDTIWSGGPYDPANPAAPDAIKQARELLFDGKQKDAEDVIQKSAMGLPPTQANYQTLGSLWLDSPDDGSPITEYRRSLDLHTAIATTTFKRNGVTFTREVFASAPDKMVIVRETADKPHSITISARLSSPFKDAQTGIEGGLLALAGTGGKFNNQPGQIKFKALARVENDGGAVESKGDTVSIAGANAVTVRIVCCTNYVNYKDLTADPDANAHHDLDAASGTGFEQLRARHVENYRKLFDRVTLDLGRNADADLPTDERVKKFDGKDTALPSLYFQFGRYLLISSSRPGGQPANLQGLWNDALTAAWGGKYTININTEENYWPSETTNLSECAQPLFQLIRDISVTGQKTAQVMYHARGWVCHHNTDLWRATAPIDSAVGFWPVGGAWLTTHLWQHYLFTGDRQFMESVYPIFKGASQFFLDTLVEEPTHHWLVTCPSMSPEHGGLTIGPTMDMSILRDLFEETAKTSELLGVDTDFRKEVLIARGRLAPFQIGNHGQLQEWITDLDSMTDTHRHLSHLYGLFPSNQISLDAAPTIFQAAKTSLIARGRIGPGWSLAWKENLWARVGDGNIAYGLLITQLTPPKGGSQGGGTFPNLFDAHPPFQIDGNFAATSAIAEMLLQSQGGYIRLLPALPDAWPNGHVQGLVARGGFVVGIKWKDHRLASATIESRVGGDCRVHFTAPLKVLDSAGQPIKTTIESGNIVSFTTDAGKTYQLSN